MFDIYSPTLQRLGQAAGIESVSWTAPWQEIGTLTMTAEADDRNRAWLTNDNFIGVEVGGKELLYVIVNRSLPKGGTKITVNAKSADYVLHWRTAPAADVENGTAESQISALIGGTDLPVTVSAARSTALPPFARQAGRLDDVVQDLLQAAQIGRECYRDGARIRYTVDYGRDRRSAAEVPVFGPSSGHYLEPEAAVDTTEAATTAKATMQYTDGSTQVITEGDTSKTGIARKEYDAGTINQNEEESKDSFTARVRGMLQRALQQNAVRVSLTAKVDWDDYGSRYRVGDLLRVESGYGVTERRIISAAWVWDSAGRRLTLTLGVPVYSELREIRRLKKAVGGGGGGGGGLSGNEEERKHDYVELIARITNAEAGMQAQVDRLDEDGQNYKQAQARLFAELREDLGAKLDVATYRDDVKGIEESIAALSARTADAESALTLTAKQSDVDQITQAQASLATRVGDAESTLKQTATKSDLTGVSEAQTKLASRVGDAEAAITLTAKQSDLDSLSSAVQSLVDIKADLINLNAKMSVASGSVNVQGNLYTTGSINASGAAYSAIDNLSVQSLDMSGKKFSAKSITSTDGTAYTVLGA